MKPNLTSLSAVTAHRLDARVIVGGESDFGSRVRLLAIGLILVCLMMLPQRATASTRSDTLEAIHWVENPSNSARPGRFGELGAYQFRSSTWRMYTRRPFSDANNRRCADEVAVQHYEWLKTTLTRAGIEATTYNIALAWNAGVNAVVQGHLSSFTRDYAARVNNLAADLGSQVAMK
jgi:hypothetical protein